MKYLKKTSYDRIYDIPEITTFGKNLYSLEFRHAEIIVNGRDKPPSEKQLKKSFKKHSIITVTESSEDWNNAIEAQLVGFVQNWESIALSLRKAVFEYYKLHYEANLEYSFFNPAADTIVMPPPTAEEVIVDLFHVGSIHLQHQSKYVGISGSCTWGEEHGWGAIIHKNEIFEVGHADIAFDPKDYTEWRLTL